MSTIEIIVLIASIIICLILSVISARVFKDILPFGPP